LDLLDITASLVRIARLIRDFHDAVEGFTPPADAQWNVLIPADGDDIIAHHDLAPWNLIHGPDRSWTFIDWDCAAPGTRLWDLAYAIHGFVPLSADQDYQRSDAGPRSRTFVDAYGLDEQERRRLVPMLSRRTRSMHDFLLAQWRVGGEPWSTLWREGHGTAWHNDADWIGQREEHWTSILLD
jgi:Ser/Thr protein kinase RdoA (MazF antagonist)